MSNKLAKKYKKILDDPNSKTLEVPSEEFNQILSDPATLCGYPKPEPPIRSSRRDTVYKEVRTGIFSKSVEKMHESEMLEYDYKDPSYLRAIDLWLSNAKKTNSIYFYGKKVVLKDDSTIEI